MKEKIQNHKRAIEDCPEHPNCFEITCKGCHQVALDFAEIRLMDLDAEIRAIIEHAKWDIKKGVSRNAYARLLITIGIMDVVRREP